MIVLADAWWLGTTLAARAGVGGARLLLVRHAHVYTGVPPGRLCGWFDPPLSPEGRTQLWHLRRRCSRSAPPDALYTSPLARARATADALADTWGVPVRPDPDLREIHCGDFEGLSIAAVSAEHPDLWQRNEAQADEHFRWPGGESYAEFRRRALRAVDTIAARHPGQRIVVVTHAGLINQILGHARARSPAQWSPDRPDPTAITEVLWETPDVRIVRFNDPGCP